MKSIFSVLLWTITTCLPLGTLANTLWQDIQIKAGSDQDLNAKVTNARHLNADIDALQARFQTEQGVWTIPLPLPDGGMTTFELVPAKVLPEALALKYPTIKTLQGHEIGNPDNRGRFDITPQGFHGMFRYNNETVFIDPQKRNNTQHYISYFRKHARPLTTIPADTIVFGDKAAKPMATAAKDFGDTVDLKTYRLAISTSAEYTAFHGGSVAEGLAAITTLTNRLNQVFEENIAISFELIVDNDKLIFTDPETDPFQNNDNNSDLEANAAVLSENVGNSNFDLGHVLTTSGGGIAYLGVVCNNTNKASGISGSRFPTADSFYIDLVAHEIGHQLGANHTFNGTAGSCGHGNRSANHAYEPGSGSTIMAYAGICGEENLQFQSDAYFHAHSIEQITNHITLGSGANCGTDTPMTGNQVPLARAPADVSIPTNTPFVLEGVGNDSSNTNLNPMLTYVWEQYDLGPASNSAATMVDDGQRSIFRSHAPSTSPNRYFPSLTSIIQQTTSLGEAYPTTDRTLNFRLTVRNSIGGVAFDDMQVTTVANAGPFAINEPLSGSVWEAFDESLISWEVSNTERAPINCKNVDIFLSTNNGVSFEHLLVKATPNTGSHLLPAPNINTPQARIQVRCSSNIFFAVNNGTFTINNTNEPFVPIITGQTAININEDTSRTIQFSDLTVTDFDNNYPDDFTLALQNGTDYQVTGQSVTPNVDFFGTMTVPVIVNDGNANSEAFNLTITVNPINDAPVATADTASVAQDSAATLIDVLGNDKDVDDNNLRLTAFTYTGKATVTIANDQLSYTPAVGFKGDDTIQYTVTDQSGATATGSITITVTPSNSSNTERGGGGSLNLLELLVLLLLAVRLRVHHD